MPWRIRQTVLIGVLCLASIAPAAEPASPVRPPVSGDRPPAATAGEAQAPGVSAEGFPFDIWYLIGEDGRPVLVPDKARLDGYLKWLAREQANQQPPLAYSVTSIACHGTAEEDALQLEIVVRLRTTGDEWALVPLQMAEATLREPPVYRGPGDAIPATYHPEGGYSFWFRGRKGEKVEHALTLSVVLPVKKQPPARRVQLSLPPTAVSSLKLRVPHARVTARGSERSKVLVRSETGVSEIEVIGLGSRLDLAWQVSPELPAADASLEVMTSITATLAEAERSATLFATQTIRSVGQQGTFDQVRVRLPTGGELLSVDSPAEYRGHQADPSDPTRIIVRLQRQTTGPVELRWTVRLPLPAEGEAFLLDGFDVDRARIQSGFLAVSVVGDFRLSTVAETAKQGPEGRSVQRINPEALPAAMRQARAMLAYRWENRFRMSLSLSRVAPFVVASPEAWVQIAPDVLRFSVTYDLQVLRGRISEMAFRWPDWKEAGWTVDRVEASENIGPQISDEVSGSETLRVEFAEPVQKRFTLTIRAERLLGEGEQVATFQLPQAETAAHSAARLSVLRPQNIELDLQPVDGTILRPLTEASGRVAVPRELQKLQRDEYRIESSRAAFRAAMTVHPRTVSATTAIAASQDRPGMTLIRQRIAYSVSYGSLAEVRFAVPLPLMPEQITVAEADGNELLVQPVDKNSREISVLLDPPRSGRFELELQFAADTVTTSTPPGGQTLRIPVIVSTDAEFSSTQFQWRDAQGYEATVQSGDWKRFPDANGLWAWKLPRSAGAIDVVLSQTIGAWSGTSITRALVRSAIAADGAIHTRAEYRLSGALIDLSVGLPPGMQIVSAWWDRHRLKLSAPQIDDEGIARYRLVPDRQTGPSPLLTIFATTPGGSLSRFTSVSNLSAPLLPENLPVHESRWQVTLPDGRHLFTMPEGVVPEFRWSRAGFFWGRQSDRGSAELEDWVGTPAGPADVFTAFEGNTYLFSRSGPASTLSFRVMSLSGIVLVGAGTALLTGWLLSRWPVTRHVLTVLLLGFVVALLSVWFLEPILVLSQPLAFGLVLAGVATAIDGFSRRRKRPLSLPLAASSDFVAAHSSIVRAASLGVGSNEFTSVRLPQADRLADVDEMADQLSESGSRP